MVIVLRCTRWVSQLTLSLRELVETCEDANACLTAIDPTAPEDYRRLAAVMVNQWRDSSMTRVILGGGQGAGKTTLCRCIQQASEFYSETVAVLSLDDFYLSKRDRKQLAKDFHPLFETRGVPGTHDLDLLFDCIRRLENGEHVEIPVFSKGIDDRVGSQTGSEKPTRILVEGWCVGTTTIPHNDLIQPINALEAEQDPELLWRSHVQSIVADSFAKLNDWSDYQVFLQVPDFSSVLRWRFAQELERPVDQRMSRVEVERFIQFYERITRWMLLRTPEIADCVVRLASDHSVADVSMRTNTPH